MCVCVCVCVQDINVSPTICTHMALHRSCMPESPLMLFFAFVRSLCLHVLACAYNPVYAMHVTRMPFVLACQPACVLLSPACLRACLQDAGDGLAAPAVSDSGVLATVVLKDGRAVGTLGHEEEIRRLRRELVPKKVSCQWDLQCIA